MLIRKLEKEWADGTAEERFYIDYRASEELGTGELVQVSSGHDAFGIMLWCERVVIRNQER